MPSKCIDNFFFWGGVIMGGGTWPMYRPCIKLPWNLPQRRINKKRRTNHIFLDSFLFVSTKTLYFLPMYFDFIHSFYYIILQSIFLCESVKLLFLIGCSWQSLKHREDQQEIIASRSQKAAQRTSHRLSRCQVVLTKRIFYSFVRNWVLSKFDFF